MSTLGAVGAFLFLVLLVLVSFGFCALAGSVVANARGLPPQVGVRFGVLLGPVGVVALLLLPKNLLTGSSASAAGAGDGSLPAGSSIDRLDPYA